MGLLKHLLNFRHARNEVQKPRIETLDLAAKIPPIKRVTAADAEIAQANRLVAAMRDGTDVPAANAWLLAVMSTRIHADNKLAHPVRFMRPGGLFERAQPPFWKEILNLRETVPFASVVQMVRENQLIDTVVRWFTQAYPAMPYEERLPHAKSMLTHALMAEWHAAQGGATFQVTRALETLLEKTDAGEVPLRYLRAPYPVSFIRFANTDDYDSGGVRCEGVYIVETPIDEHAVASTFVFVHQGINSKTSPCYILGSDIYTDDTVATLQELFKRNANKLVFKYQESEKRLWRDVDKLGKVLLYMGSREQRGVVEQPTWSVDSRLPESARRVFKGLRGSRPIMIGPSKMVEPALAGSSGRVMPAHWRRGHFHHVRYGEGKHKSKLMFYAPILVNDDAVRGHKLAKRTYKIGPHATGD